MRPPTRIETAYSWVVVLTFAAGALAASALSFPGSQSFAEVPWIAAVILCLLCPVGFVIQASNPGLPVSRQMVLCLGLTAIYFAIVVSIAAENTGNFF